MTPGKLHAILYTVLGAVLLFLVWLWHDTRAHDEAAMAAIASARSNQVQVDKQAADQTAAANAALKQQNATLQQQLSAAKTAEQQAQLINEAAGTHVEVPPPQSINPSHPQLATIPLTDLPLLAKDATDCEELQNQVAADKLQQAASAEQITARDKTLSADQQEIQALKGGSHWHRFLKAAKEVGIGVAIGFAADEVINHK